MNEPEVRRHDDADVLVGDVASALLDRLEAAQARGEVPQVGLTGGTIAEELHRELARRAVDSAVDWSRVVFWWGDERFVPADSPDRNARQARESLLDHVPVDPANVHEVPASDQVATAEDAAAAYGEAMRQHGAGFFEVLMLGIGPDGHCASLFPGHAGAGGPRRDRRRRPRLPQAAARPRHPHLRGDGALPRGVVHRQRRRQGRGGRPRARCRRVGHRDPRPRRTR